MPHWGGNEKLPIYNGTAGTSTDLRQRATRGTSEALGAPDRGSAQGRESASSHCQAPGARHRVRPKGQEPKEPPSDRACSMIMYRTGLIMSQTVRHHGWCPKCLNVEFGHNGVKRARSRSWRLHSPARSEYASAIASYTRLRTTDVASARPTCPNSLASSGS
jgi:hypothetical protein